MIDADTVLDLSDALLSAEQVARFFKKSLSTLSRWRSQGRGPRYIQVGGTIAYRHSDIEEYLTRHRRQCTAGSIRKVPAASIVTEARP